MVRVVLAIAMLALCASALSQPPSPTPPKLGEAPKNDAKSYEQGAATEQRSADKYSVTVNVLPTTNAEKKSESDTAKHDQEPTHDWGLIIPTWILALATIGLFIFTARLWMATSTLVKHTEESSKRQLRAYVFEQAETEPSNWPEGYRVHFEIKNVGATPAYKVCCWSRVKALDHRTIDKYQFEGVPEEIEGPRFVVNPGSTHTQSEGVRLTVDEQHGVQDGVTRLYLWGEIRYKDAFRCGHTSQFRLYWHVSHGLGIWAYCDDGNDAD